MNRSLKLPSYESKRIDCCQSIGHECLHRDYSERGWWRREDPEWYLLIPGWICVPKLEFPLHISEDDPEPFLFFVVQFHSLSTEYYFEFFSYLFFPPNHPMVTIFPVLPEKFS